jgi:tetratricopeptide (TPR) repeat protein
MTGMFTYPKRHLKKLIKSGEYVEALEFGTSIESKFSGDKDFMFIMGSLYYILEDGKKALPYFEKSLKLDSTDVESLMLKTNAHLLLQLKEEAVKCCKRILEIQPDNYEAHGLLEKLENI